MIEARELAKSFAGVSALDGVSFRAEDGRITGLLGPNGAGKSTTLRILSTLLKPDRGTALVDGCDVVGSSLEARRRLGVLVGPVELYPRLTARENVEYYGRLQGLRGKELRARVDRLVDQLGIDGFADRPARGLAPGEHIRVALARALVHEPRNVLLFNPTEGLDVAGTRALLDVVRRLRDAGTCVLISSHRMHQMGELCDRAVILARGRVVADGTPAEICGATGAPDLEEALVKAASREEVH